MYEGSAVLARGIPRSWRILANSLSQTERTPMHYTYTAPAAATPATSLSCGLLLATNYAPPPTSHIYPYTHSPPIHLAA
jgi:hypothetical protein